jgi:hypothetical protein
MPCEGIAPFDTLVRSLPLTSPVGLLLRDRFGGRVGTTRARHAVGFCRLSRYDQRYVRRAVEGARVLQAAGALEVFCTQTRHGPWATTGS